MDRQCHRPSGPMIHSYTSHIPPSPAPAPASSTLTDVEGMWSDGTSVYAADNLNNAILKIDRISGQTSTFVSGIHAPIGIWGDGANLYVTQAIDKTITKISLSTRDT